MPRRADGLGLAQAACVAGLGFALVSLYWALGGDWLLDTIGGSLEAEGRSGDAGVLLALWAAVALKTVAAIVPLLAIRRLRSVGRRQAAWVLAWAAATFLTMYGLLHTGVGLLLQAGIVHASADADQHALAWRAYLWDPWFLAWGLLAVGAMVRARRGGLPSHQARLRA